MSDVTKRFAVEGKGRMLSWTDPSGQTHMASIIREYPDNGTFLVGNPDDPTTVRTRLDAEWKNIGQNENVAVSFKVS